MPSNLHHATELVVTVFLNWKRDQSGFFFWWLVCRVNANFLGKKLCLVLSNKYIIQTILRHFNKSGHMNVLLWGSLKALIYLNPPFGLEWQIFLTKNSLLTSQVNTCYNHLLLSMFKSAGQLLIFCWFLQGSDGSKEVVKEMTLVILGPSMIFPTTDTKPIW